MRRFLLELAAFVVLQAVVAAMVWRACPRREDHYAAATRDKRLRLERCASPRIIFVGGSSAAFGFDSRVAARSGLNPVNMGHNRSLGLRFMLSQVRAQMRPGDVVIVSPEYELLWKPGVDSTLVTHLEYDPASLTTLELETGRRLLDRALPWIAGKVRCATHQVSTAAPIGYTRDAFDDTGDFSSHRGKPPQPHDFSPVTWPEPDALQLEPSLALLSDFAARCHDVGARCFYAFAPIRRGQFQANRATVLHLARAIAERSNLPIAIPLEAAIFDHRAYYDAGPHLLPTAATRRTRDMMPVVTSPDSSERNSGR